MQIVIRDFTDPPPKPQDLGRRFQEILGERHAEITVSEEELPTDVDLPFYLVAVGGAVAALFFAGKKIEENLDAWFKLAQRFRALVTEQESLGRTCTIDEHGAELLAIEDAFRNSPEGVFKISRVERISTTVLKAHTPHLRHNATPGIILGHNLLYIVTLRINHGDFVVKGVSARGEVVFSHSVGEWSWMEFVQSHAKDSGRP